MGYVEIVRTHLRKHVLSRSAPTQPTNDRTKMKIASVMTRIVRSKTTSNTSEYLDRSESCTSLTPLASLRRFFSENAQHPAPTNANAANSTTQHTTLGNTQHQNYNRTDCGCSKVRFCPYISPNWIGLDQNDSYSATIEWPKLIQQSMSFLPRRRSWKETQTSSELDWLRSANCRDTFFATWTKPNPIEFSAITLILSLVS